MTKSPSQESLYSELVDGIALHFDREVPAPSTNVDVAFGAKSSKGRSREVNEDHYLVIRLERSQQTLLSSLTDDFVTSSFEEHGHAIMIADGMGGTGAGETASRFALVTLLHLVRHFGRWNLRIDDKVAREIIDRARRFYRHVDNAVSQRGAVEPQRRLQTTLTAVFGAGRDLFFAHVGHSRAYLMRDGQLLRLTRDHTVGRRPATAPPAPLIEVNTTARDLQHILTDSIGMSGAIGPQIDIERFQLLDRDAVLVCTNGLTDAIDEAAIAEVLGSDRSPDAQCQTLVDLARAETSAADDDVTAVIAHYHVPDQ